MTLDMLYSTYQSRIYELLKNLPKETEGTTIIIVHQVTYIGEYSSVFEKINQRTDIIYIESLTKGVARSRNLAISNSRSELVLFCDDDVTYANDVSKIVIDSYSQNSAADSITFAYSKGSSMMAAERFSSTTYKHNLKTIFSIGTIEISCKRASLVESMALFPENLGAGEKYYLCDEPVFMSRLLKAGMQLIYIPEVIGNHPEFASGINFNDLKAFKSRLICFQYIFGRFLGVGIYNIFLLKNISKLRLKFFPVAFLLVYFS